MHIICLTPLEEGVYNEYASDNIAMPPEGWAMIEEGFPLPATFPRLGSIKAEEKTFKREFENRREVTKTREVESFKPVVKTREVEKLDEEGKTITVTEEYTEMEPCMVTEEYKEWETFTDEKEVTILTVTEMTEGTMPEVEPEEEKQSPDERITALEEQLAETDEVAIDLYEASLAQAAINAEQDEAIIEIYEMMEGANNG